MQTFKSFILFTFYYFLFIYIFPFCLYATSVLHKLTTILFYHIKCFWIFDIFLNFLYVLDVSKNKVYCNIWFYLIVKRHFFYLIVKLWPLLWSGTIHLVIVSRILSCIFEGDDITSQVEGYFSVLFFSILLLLLLLLL